MTDPTPEVVEAVRAGCEFVMMSPCEFPDCGCPAFPVGVVAAIEKYAALTASGREEMMEKIHNLAFNGRTYIRGGGAGQAERCFTRIIDNIGALRQPAEPTND